jgi:hypothetical protein
MVDPDAYIAVAVGPSAVREAVLGRLMDRGILAMIVVSFVVFVACVKLLVASGDPLVSAAILTTAKLLFAIMLGASGWTLAAVVLIVGTASFGYFSLLGRLDGRRSWWVVLACGVGLLGVA